MDRWTKIGDGMGRWADGQSDSQKVVKTDRQTDIQTDKQMALLTDRKTDG